MRFREHRGMLDESMATTIEVADRAALVEIIRARLAVNDFFVTDDMVQSKPYGHDKRIGWDQHLVTVTGYGVVGMTDAPP